MAANFVNLPSYLSLPQSETRPSTLGQDHVYNLRRALNILGVATMMAAIRA
jgi:hypothetical protein